MKQKLFILMIVLTTIAMVLTSAKHCNYCPALPEPPRLPPKLKLHKFNSLHMEQPAYQAERYQELIDVAMLLSRHRRKTGGTGLGTLPESTYGVAAATQSYVVYYP
jgi:hypothetical protein